ncbi:DUF397 domain-containing protein [Streptomyces albogriseolus]|uniref:DUF397 domain-containing protein n=1 Tax=Streptomyces albogriseolus TaxID=1887 RepID=UPI0037BC8750
MKRLVAESRRSSYSGEGDGNNCGEAATSPARTAVRDSKAPGQATLTFSDGPSPSSSAR